MRALEALTCITPSVCLAFSCATDEPVDPVEEPIILWCAALPAYGTKGGENERVVGVDGGPPTVCLCARPSDFSEHDVRSDVLSAYLEHCLELAAEQLISDEGCYYAALREANRQFVFDEGDCDASSYDE